MFIVIDLETGEVYERTPSYKGALNLAEILEQIFAWDNNHAFGVVTD